MGGLEFLILSREYGKIVYRDYIGIICPYLEQVSKPGFRGVVGSVFVLRPCRYNCGSKNMMWSLHLRRLYIGII